MAQSVAVAAPALSARRVLLPLVLAQFICSFAGSNMNVMITPMSEDLNTTVQGIQLAITLFLLVMAALMIPGGKLTDIWGRKRCFRIGLAVYGVGAVISAAAPGLGVLILGNSLLEGIGTALLIPPVYILATMFFSDLASRARAFGSINGAGGVGAAAGPLIGGVIATAITWRAAFLFQAAIIAIIVVLSRRIEDPVAADPDRPFDVTGAVLSAVGLVLIVMGILAADVDLRVTIVAMLIGAAVLALFFWHVRRMEAAGKEPLLRTALFRNRVSNIGLVTQNIQWLVLLGLSFVISVYLQVVRGYNPIETGLVFTAATVGILISSLGAQRFAQRRSQRTLILAGFVVTIIGVFLLMVMVNRQATTVTFLPGLFLVGFGVGLMLTPSVNVVQSSFPEDQQGEISGLSRAVSNLGSSFGTAIAGTILVSGLASPERSYGLAVGVLGIIAIIGFAAALMLPARPAEVVVEPAPA